MCVHVCVRVDTETIEIRVACQTEGILGSHLCHKPMREKMQTMKGHRQVPSL